MKIVCILVIILICQQFVSGLIIKQLYYSDPSCSSDPVVTSYLDTSGSCKPTNCSSGTSGSHQVYVTTECGNSEIPSSPTTTDLTIFSFKNETHCHGPLKIALIMPLYKCIFDYGGTFYVIYEPSGSGSKSYFYDSTCKGKIGTGILFFNTCLIVGYGSPAGMFATKASNVVPISPKYSGNITTSRNVFTVNSGLKCNIDLIIFAIVVLLFFILH